jgi:hypothetical protein
MISSPAEPLILIVEETEEIGKENKWRGPLSEQKNDALTK